VWALLCSDNEDVILVASWSPSLMSSKYLVISSDRVTDSVMAIVS
jgi:hypothetical protein